eukprot:gene32278-41832_t
MKRPLPTSSKNAITNQNKTTEPRKASDAVGLIMWPKALTKDEAKKLVINCVIFNIKDEGYLVLSADCKGLKGDGDTKEEAISDFRENVEEVINEERGGIFPDTCDENEQILLLQDIMDEWNADGLEVISREAAEISDFYKI